MNCKSYRTFFDLSNRRLRRARRLYVRLCIPEMEKNGNAILDHMAQRMMEGGLYSSWDKSGRGVRQGIGGHYFQITKHLYPAVRGHFHPWYKWCEIVNWLPYDGHFSYDRPFNIKPKISIKAVISEICTPSTPYQEIWE